MHPGAETESLFQFLRRTGCLDPTVCRWPSGRCVEPSRCTAPTRYWLGSRDWRWFWLRHKRVLRHSLRLSEVNLPVYVAGPNADDIRRMRGDA